MIFSMRGSCFPTLLLALSLAACAPQISGRPGNTPAATEQSAVPAQPPCALVEGRPAAPPETTEPSQSAPAPGVATESPNSVGGTVADAVTPPEAAAIPAPAPDVEKREEETPVLPLSPPEPGYESRATYYSKWFDGRPTITDEIYDPNKMTAATHDLPLGTLARVVNPKNGREVIVRVNDRPRKRNFPLIDLSRAAAKKLGFYGQGLIRVRVIPLPPDAPEYASVEKKKRKK